MKSQKPRHSPALYGSKALQKCKKYKCHNLSHFESCLLTQHIDIIMQRHAEVSCKSVFRNFKKCNFWIFSRHLCTKNILLIVVEDCKILLQDWQCMSKIEYTHRILFRKKSFAALKSYFRRDAIQNWGNGFRLLKLLDTYFSNFPILSCNIV